MRERAAIILAAGMGTRMKSALPKVLHKVGGRPSLDWSIALARRLGCSKIVTVISPDTPELEDHVTNVLGASAIVFQPAPLGTGHAVSSAAEAFAGFDGSLVVLCGDSPLVPEEAIRELFEALEGGVSLGVLGFETDEPRNYGRLILGTDGELEAIVEAREASPEQLAVRFCNSCFMAGDAVTMFSLLRRVTNDNAKGEYYLTDLVGLAREDGLICCAIPSGEAYLVGCDTRLVLSDIEATFQADKRAAMLESGVTLIAPETVFFSYDTQIAPDVEIEPNVVFGPGVQIASGARIRAFSHLEGADVGPNCEVGPYARLRPGTVLKTGAKIGNFVEVKKTIVGEGAKANHLSYLGDGEVGAGANIGAGTIFCNYDGFFKYQTIVGERAFIGSNSALVAPVRIGDGAMVGSGSVVTKDVPADGLVLARAQQVEKPGWAKRFRDLMTERKNKKG